MKNRFHFLLYILPLLVGFWLGHAVGVSSAWRIGTAFTANQLIQAHKMIKTMDSEKAAEKVFQLATNWENARDLPGALWTPYNPIYIYDSFTLSAEKDIRQKTDSYLANPNAALCKPK